MMKGSKADSIATIAQFKADTRVKRSGDLHWYPVAQEIQCYPDDSVFTGTNSIATIDLVNGGSITLHPNSLITLTEGRVSLNSGTIDIKIDQGKLEVESFGEIIQVASNDKIRIENHEKNKKITPLAKTWSGANKTKYQAYVLSPTLKLLKPETFENIPRLEDKYISFDWYTENKSANTDFKIEFSQDQDFKNILLVDRTIFSSLKIDSGKLPEGLLYWRVTHGELKETSSFYHLGDFRIDHIQPLKSEEYQLEEAQTAGIPFEWTNPLQLPQLLQVSKEESFTANVTNETINETKKKLNFTEEGQYFWRIGYVLNGQTHWSEVSNFSLKPTLKTVPLAINKIPRPLDFSLIESFEIQITAPKEIENYEFLLTQGEKVIQSSKAQEPRFKIEPLPDGVYILQVTGSNQKQTLTGRATKEILVKKSKPIKAPPKIPATIPAEPTAEPPAENPLEAPKLKNKKKVKIFVKAFNAIFNSLFPTAEAATPEYFYSLQWEPVEGASYEVEVSKTDQKQVILTEETTEPRYKLIISGPEAYYWRVRTKIGDRWSPFSEYALVEVQDKVLALKSPLMISPAHGANAILKNNEMSFSWKAPVKGTYFLEYSTDPNTRKVKRKKVSGEQETVRIEGAPQKIYWRVFVKSPYGNRNPNKQFFTSKVKTINDKFPFGKVLARVALHQSQSDFQLEASSVDVEKETPLSGQILTMDLEHFPHRFKYNSIHLSLRSTALKDGDNKLDEKKLGAEFSWLLSPKSKTHQQFYLGYFLLMQYDLQLDSGVEATYSANFLSARYLIRHPLSQRLRAELNSMIQSPITFDFTPSLSFRPGLSYRLNQKWWIDFFAMYERYYTRPEIDNNKRGANITLTNLAFGLGLSWNPYSVGF